MILKIYDYLIKNGIDTYFVGQHQGECLNPFVVVKDDGITSLNGKVGTGYIDLIFFVPVNTFTECEPFKKRVKDLIKEQGKLRYTGTETGIVTDDEKQALTCSVIYEINKLL